MGMGYSHEDHVSPSGCISNEVSEIRETNRLLEEQIQILNRIEALLIAQSSEHLQNIPRV